MPCFFFDSQCMYVIWAMRFNRNSDAYHVNSNASDSDEIAICCKIFH